jgi:hypothetical protein
MNALINERCGFAIALPEHRKPAAKHFDRPNLILFKLRAGTGDVPMITQPCGTLPEVD